MSAYKEFKKDLFRIVLGTLIVYIAISLSGYGRDDSDGETRSGLGVHTDAKTGCEYLSSPRGGLIARTNADGRHICKPVRKPL